VSRMGDWIDLLQWPATAVTLYAASLIGSKRCPGWHDEAWELIVLQVGLRAMNARGIAKNEK
jgi:hypothetical protein